MVKFYFCLLLLFGAFSTSSCGVKEPANTPKASRPPAAKPVPLAATDRCASSAETLQKESNVFTCPSFASRRYHVHRSQAVWFKQNAVQKVGEVIGESDRAFLAQRFFNDDNQDQTYFELGLFFEKNAEFEDFFKKLDARFERMIEVHEWKESFNELDSGFIERDVVLDSSVRLFYAPSSPRHKNRLAYHLDTYLNRSEASDLWKQRLDLINQLNRTPLYTEWLNLLERFGFKPRRDLLEDRPFFASRLQFELAYRWRSEGREWQRGEYRVAPQWTLTRPLQSQ